MTREDYIKELSERLKYVEEKDKKNALDYCKEYFDEAGYENEQKAILELGTPAQFAANVMGSIAIKRDNFESNKSNKKNIKTIWIVILSIIALPLGLPLIITISVIIFSLIVVLVSVAVALFFSLSSFIPILLGGIVFSGYMNSFIIIGIVLISIALFGLFFIILFLMIKYVVILIKKLVIFIFNKLNNIKSKINY